MLTNTRRNAPRERHKEHEREVEEVEIGITLDSKQVYLEFDKDANVWLLTPEEAHELSAALDVCANKAEGRKSS